ncbi:HAD family hydrolase [Nocardioides litoris]|uniref:HAD family hydrolase n=1 Tax=Nocardioides litoris TaxID=1926648 RepID=UPI00112125A9|nr:HAD family phosphatase [Nocardioides litoris]
MAISIPDRVVVLDYGEVISRSPSPAARTALAEAAGVPLAELEAAYDVDRLALDGGELGVVDYWRAMGERLGRTYSLSEVQRLWTIDFTSWFEPEPAVVDLLVELHEGGTRLALLSNAGLDFGDPLRRTPFATLMEQVFVSAEMGLVKPDPEIYRRTMEGLGVGPEQTVFVDNKAVNTDAAAALGITVHHFTGVAGLRAFCESLGAAGR